MHNCQCGQRTVFTGACHYNCDRTIICTQPGLRDFSDSPVPISLTLDLTLRGFANTNSENIQWPGGLGLKGRNFETINLFITTQVVTEAAWEPGLLGCYRCKLFYCTPLFFVFLSLSSLSRSFVQIPAD